MPAMPVPYCKLPLRLLWAYSPFKDMSLVEKSIVSYLLERSTNLLFEAKRFI